MHGHTVMGEQAVTCVVVALDDLFDLPLTSGAVGVLESREFAPSEALCRPHHTLESPMVVSGAVSVPGGDTARQDALN